MFPGLEPRLEILEKQLKYRPSSVFILVAVLHVLDKGVKVSDQGCYLPIEILYKAYQGVIEDAKIRKAYSQGEALTLIESYLLQMSATTTQLKINRSHDESAAGVVASLFGPADGPKGEEPIELKSKVFFYLLQSATVK